MVKIFKYGLFLGFAWLISAQAWANFDAAGERKALAYLNALRADLKLTPLVSNPKLHQAARAHARYDTVNNQQGHYEKRGVPFYTGKRPKDRVFYQGYHSSVSEVVSYNSKNPRKYINDLMSAIYHRLGLLDMTKTDVGVGLYRDRKGHLTGTFVADIGNRYLNRACQQHFRNPGGLLAYKGLCRTDRLITLSSLRRMNLHTARKNPDFIMWPKSGATVPPVFYEEDPDPLPQCNVTGYPVHIQMNPELWGKVKFVRHSFKLTHLSHSRHASVQPITVFSNLTDPNHRDKRAKHEKWLAFFPKKRLDWNSRYQAEVKFIKDGRVLTSRWNFYTPTLPNLVVVKKPRVTLSARPNQTITLYFPPKTCRAPMTSKLSSKHSRQLKFKAGFVDTQTLKVTFGSQKGTLILIYRPTNTQVTFHVR